ncbi:uncharacterized protein LOC129566919 isoform X1 [Sitodiplosis mosellana]|uniref:uncharacterized protein LOC129566919 isoform X1 n=1 Tax=Sitodiplosis mosellana TaxID=263140 RepID=UPI002443770D|nr:uncharacterized protein LOC129566919 isoform X1 [Sitodiplosis mosellana]
MLIGEEVVFKNVRKVSIIGGKLGLGLKLNRLFPEMRWLELCPEEVTDPECIQETFPHLEYLKIKAYAYIESQNITRRNLMVVIDLNPQLRRLNLLSDCDPNTWNHVSMNLNQLEALDIVYSPILVHKYTDVIQFESVQQLTISIINSDLERYNAERATILTFNRLKECTLKGRVNDVWYQFVLENSTIEKLTIVSENDCLCIDQRLLQIVNKLTKLTEISIDGCRFSVEKVNQFLEKGNYLTRVHLIGNIMPARWKEQELLVLHPEEKMHKREFNTDNWILTKKDNFRPTRYLECDLASVLLERRGTI